MPKKITDKESNKNDEAKAELAYYTSRNIRALRECLNINQEAMSRMMGGTARSGCSTWENAVDKIPSVIHVKLLKAALAADPNTRDYSTFSLDDFYSSLIDFTRMAGASGAKRFPHFCGAYIAYFYDFSEVRVNALELSRLKMRYMVLYVYEALSTAGKNELRVMAVPFKHAEDAEALKDELDALKTGDEWPTAQEVQRFFAAKAAVINKNDLHTGHLTFLDEDRFRISFCNGAMRDDVSILLFLPPDNGKKYYGGLGAMTSVARGIHRNPTAQKVIISRHPSSVDECTLGEYLRVRTSDLPLERDIREAVDAYNKLATISDLNDDDRIRFLSYRLLGAVNAYNTQLNLCGFDVSREEDNAVFHLLKHLSFQPR